VRVDALGQVEAHSVWKLRPVSLSEISETGFSLDATAPFEMGSPYKFRLGDDAGRSVVIQAVCRHCALKSASRGLAIYTVGFEFTSLNALATSEIAALVEYARAMWTDPLDGPPHANPQD
jgi:hypothetical protein